jgi:hypothetical protein
LCLQSRSQIDVQIRIIYLTTAFLGESTSHTTAGADPAADELDVGLGPYDHQGVHRYH